MVFTYYVKDRENRAQVWYLRLVIELLVAKVCCCGNPAGLELPVSVVP